MKVNMLYSLDRYTEFCRVWEVGGEVFRTNVHKNGSFAYVEVLQDDLSWSTLEALSDGYTYTKTVISNKKDTNTELNEQELMKAICVDEEFLLDLAQVLVFEKRGN